MLKVPENEVPRNLKNSIDSKKSRNSMKPKKVLPQRAQ